MSLKCLRTFLLDDEDGGDRRECGVTTGGDTACSRCRCCCGMTPLGGDVIGGVGIGGVGTLDPEAYMFLDEDIDDDDCSNDTFPTLSFVDDRLRALGSVRIGLATIAMVQ